MHLTPKYLTPLFIAGTAAIAIAAAPMANAAPQSCVDSGFATQCGSPGNNQITASTPRFQQPTVIIIRRHR
ncbi:MAG: hypothetical protein ABWY93_33375 [Mycobacterium sp.]